MKITAIAIMAGIVLTLGLAQYFSRRYINQPAISAQSTQTPSPSTDIPRVKLCELLRNPMAYKGQVIRIDSTLGRFRDYVTFYDSNCVPKHPLIKVQFSPSLKYEKGNQGEKLRQIITGSKEAREGNVHLLVSAIGLYEPIPRDRRSDFSELQYEITITSIEMLEEK